MTRDAPDRLADAVAWDLRGAWAGGWEVVVTTWADVRARGYVEHVAATGAYATLSTSKGDLHVPLDVVRSVRKPHFHEDGSGPGERRPGRRPVVMDGQLAFDLGPYADGLLDSAG